MTNSYYLSHLKLSFIGTGGQRKLDDARVLVIGAGGLGCPCLLALAGCGVGNIGIADFDTVSISNLHRQTLYTMDDIGKNKTSVAAKRLSAHNAYVKITEHHVLVNEQNILDLIEHYDIIVDGTDNFLVRYLINDACVFTGKPLVYGAIHQAEGQVTVFNLNGSPTLRCLFPEPSYTETIASCAEIGAYTITTGVIGMMMANEVVKIILGDREVLSGRLLYFDCINASSRTITYKELEQSRTISAKRFSSDTDIDTDPINITADEFHQRKKNGFFRLIDVRESEEREAFDFGGEHIPLSNLSVLSFSHISPQESIYIYCQTGVRSNAAAVFLREHGYPLSYSIAGGLHALLASNL